MGSYRHGLLAQTDSLGILERPFTLPDALLLDGETGLDPEELSFSGREIRLTGRELGFQLGDAATSLVDCALTRLASLGLTRGELALSPVEPERALVERLESVGELQLTQVRRLALLSLDGARTFFELECPRVEPVALGGQLLLGRLDRGDPADELVGRAREGCLLLLLEQVAVGELLLASHARRLCLGELLLAGEEARPILLEQPFAFADRSLPFADRTLPLGSSPQPLGELSFLLGPRK